MDVSPLTCNAQQLYTILSGSNRSRLRLGLSNPAVTENHVLALLRNSFITADLIQDIFDRLDWASSYKVQVAAVSCPKTPFAMALRLIPMLFWNDLSKVVNNPRVSPRLRRSAEKYLNDKVRELTLGEKMSAARTGPRPLIHLLIREKDPRVIQAVLRNPQLIEDDLLVLINNEHTPAEVLQIIGVDFKWCVRYAIRLALVRNPETPLSVALSFLSKLRNSDLRAVKLSPDTPELIRRTAHRILSGDY
jgi:hypothetical protein